ncbi:RNA 2',3'-cyclic phosphodiesterase [Methanoplanus endosymbiosus]|uniref:RNA 2',3'-cyclic phosphodiesterase n=1 Tax=Methanoplanus endosymbiosus TaxID=33865 RepID=A0A9E7PLL8_9EURY|nr:RNA 2',3'-cyclic phosphodiesterase [Methanoplanus endosymbiosus]UUX92404.1 RNA 2',3'-cyclic phosphodiesterase [Methanoplanus endosymbiosus]
MARVFVAIELPPEIKEQFHTVHNILKESDAKLTFVHPDIAHITLKFIGEVNEDKLSEIITALKKLSFNPFEMATGKPELNSRRNPRVIWIPCTDEGESEELFSAVEELLSQAGIPKEKRDFKAHATLARIKKYEPGLKEIIYRNCKDNFSFSPERFQVSAIYLKKSTLTPQGPVYEDILEVKF